MQQCFNCGKKAISEHEICKECVANPFITEKYRKYLARNKKRQLFIETFRDGRFENFSDINSAKSWDFLIKYHRHYEDVNKITILRIQKIVELIPADRDIKIFDLGFGYGHVLLELANRGYTNLGGVDISREAVRDIKERIPNGIFFIGNVTDIPLKDESIDVVLANEIMEHIPVKGTFRVYDEIKRISKKKGFMLFSVPLGDNLETTTFMCPHGQLVNPNGHVREYTPEVLELELEIAKLTPLKKILLIPPIQGKLKLLKSISKMLGLIQPSNFVVKVKKRT